MPEDVFKMFQKKKVKMEADVEKIVGKHVPLTMPKVFRLVASTPVEIYHDDLIKVAKNKKRLFHYA